MIKIFVTTIFAVSMFVLVVYAFGFLFEISLTCTKCSPLYYNNQAKTIGDYLFKLDYQMVLALNQINRDIVIVKDQAINLAIILFFIFFWVFSLIYLVIFGILKLIEKIKEEF